MYLKHRGWVPELQVLASNFGPLTSQLQEHDQMSQINIGNTGAHCTRSCFPGRELGPHAKSPTKEPDSGDGRGERSGPKGNRQDRLDRVSKLVLTLRLHLQIDSVSATTKNVSLDDAAREKCS